MGLDLKEAQKKLRKRGVFGKPDLSIKKKLSKQEQIGELETKRDILLDHNFPKRAAAIESQIRRLKREVGS